MSQALAKYMTQQCWAVHEPVLRSGAELIERQLRGEKIDAASVALIVAERDAKQEEKRADSGRPVDSKAGPDGYYMEGSVAVVPIEGVLTKYASMVNGQSQPAGTTSSAIVESVAKARTDPRAKSILLAIDSPGGSVAGLDDVVQAIKEAKTEKPVWAFAHDQMASAAYWIGSQADKLMAGPSSGVGSIGVYTLLQDNSKAVESRGTKFHLVKAGKFKGIGSHGITITPEDLAAVQQQVEGYYAAFVRDVAAGRGLSKERTTNLADGRMWVGQDAVTMGLADGLGTFTQIVARMNEKFTNGPRRDAPSRGRQATALTENRMNLSELKAAHPDLIEAHEREVTARVEAAAAEKNKPVAATIADLKAAFPGAEKAAFREACLEGTMTMEQAKIAHGDLVAAELVATKAKLTATEAEVAKLKALGGAGAGNPAVTAAKTDPALPDPASLPKGASREMREAFAKKEWAANVDDCNLKFYNEATYCGWRVPDLATAAV